MFEDALRNMIREEVRAAVSEAMNSQPTSKVAAERLTVKEAALVAKVTEKTIRNWLNSGALRAFHAGRQLRIDREELNGFMLTGPKKNEEATPEQLAILHLRRKAS